VRFHNPCSNISGPPGLAIGWGMEGYCFTTLTVPVAAS